MSDEQHRISNSEIMRLVYKHDQDLYFGNGKPGLTTRIAVMEHTLEQITRNLTKIVWLIVGGIITGVIAFIVDLAVRAK